MLHSVVFSLFNRIVSLVANGVCIKNNKTERKMKSRKWKYIVFHRLYLVLIYFTLFLSRVRYHNVQFFVQKRQKETTHSYAKTYKLNVFPHKIYANTENHTFFSLLVSCYPSHLISLSIVYSHLATLYIYLFITHSQKWNEKSYFDKHTDTHLWSFVFWIV